LEVPQLIWMTADILKASQEISRIDKEMARVESNDAITDEHISNARRYPIERLIEFKKGKALAFCHDDSNPSLSLHSKSNTCRCFTCDKSFDSISVLMVRDKMTFLQAVRQLQQ